jgi:hypothetical protein
MTLGSPILISLGRDFRLLRERSDALTARGFCVLNVGDLAGALDVLHHPGMPVDGAIICHSFTSAERHHIEHVLRRTHPYMTVLSMRSETDSERLRFTVSAYPRPRNHRPLGHFRAA